MTERIFTLILVVLILFAAFMAWGHEGDEPNADWFNTLKIPGTGVSCCNMHHDCDETDYRMNGDDYEAMFHGRWVVIPKDRVLQGTTNPTGRAVLCGGVIESTGQPIIYCFIRANET